jgi:ubiquinone/menaquinone biosynthesis C-methylase UbiE
MGAWSHCNSGTIDALRIVFPSEQLIHLFGAPEWRAPACGADRFPPGRGSPMLRPRLVDCDPKAFITLRGAVDICIVKSMLPDLAEDVPSPIDLRSMDDARDWSAPLRSSGQREQFFQQFVVELRAIGRNSIRVLELGSGPGFLARRVLEAIPAIEYTMLDFSPAMHELASERLGSLMQHVRPVVADFKCDNWGRGLGEFDAVVTNQAVHELRHKRHAVGLHKVVRSLLRAEGRYLVCDHYVGADGMTNAALYMTVAEQYRCLEEAGFSAVTNLLEIRGLVLHRATAR